MHVRAFHACGKGVHLPMNMSKRPEEDGFLALSSPFYSLKSSVFLARLTSKPQCPLVSISQVALGHQSHVAVPGFFT